ncbi:glycoside hydrolase family 43 protein [Paenibacillus mesophilus]|uniref:glycoside hydrolase family 43 protein n=1 Tax=Paenibacillus mesophilus TaxID=2582849 RepID=UPI0013050B81|nr:glycoside hydrolase family 43 protein [Paenibacillus mesophilus]
MRLMKTVILMTVVSVMMVGCKSGTSPTSNELKATESQTPVVGKAPDGTSYHNPLLKNIADPSVFRDSNGLYYMYPTGGNKFKAYSSPDLVHWKDAGIALNGGEVPWADNKFWAPDVKEHGGKYYMFFSATKGKDYPRISVAVSDKPTGPFHTLSEKPLFDFGYGTIDPFVFFDDDGKIYMYYSVDLHTVGDHSESQIHVAQLSNDLQSVIGEPRMLTHPEQTWESSGKQRWNEGSWVHKHKGTYYLMYSANCYCGKSYAIGYATSKNPLGPFVKYVNNPVLSANYPQVSGTGHHSIVPSPDGKELFIVYPSHIDVKKGGGSRQLHIDRMGLRDDGTLYVNGPTLTEQPLPSGTNIWKNIAGEAKLSASSTDESSNLKFLVDGEIGIYKRTSSQDWISASNDSSPWVQLEWDQPFAINGVWIYDSGDSAKALQSGTLILDSGKEKKEVRFPTEPGAAAIVQLNGQKAKKIKFVPDTSKPGSSPVALSEIMVLGQSGR